MPKLYPYVGPQHLMRGATGAVGSAIHGEHDLKSWLLAHPAEVHGGHATVTFVICADEVLRIATRNSEHVACASRQPVLAAGELVLRIGTAVRVVEASNQSTGYCPEPESWQTAAYALEHAHVEHPRHLTHSFIFRRCEECGQINVVKDEWFVCAMCAAPLPLAWNFDHHS